MGAELNKSRLSNETVQRVIENGYKTIKAVNGGRNPTPEQREKVREMVVKEARMIDQRRVSR